MYENKNKETNVVKEIILEAIDYLRFKIENDRLTMKEADSLAKTIESNLELTGTADDFSEFYKQPTSNVRLVIHRKLFAKPKRKVFYPFRAFREIVPKSWKK